MSGNGTRRVNGTSPSFAWLEVPYAEHRGGGHLARVIKSAAESESLAEQVKDTSGCCILPAFSGLGAPYWDPYARGIISGITLGTDKRPIVRAALESIAHQASGKTDRNCRALIL